MPKVVGTPTVRYNLQDTKAKESTIAMLFRYQYKGKTVRLKYGPGLPVLTKFWNNKTQFPKKHPSTNNLISSLLRLESIVLSIYAQHNGNLTIEEFRKELSYQWEGKPRPKDADNHVPAFLDFIERYVKRKKKSVKRGTWKNLETWQNHLVTYSEKKQVDLTYNSITPAFKDDFVNWCYEDNNHSINYVSKGISIIREFMAAAADLNYHSNSYPQTKAFKIKKIPTPTISLSKEELDNIFNLDLSNHAIGLQKARALFLIGAYTGLRQSDYSRIKSGHIIEEHGRKLILIMARKTNKMVKIPLHTNLETILKEWGYSAPKLSQQKLNKYIKDIAEMAGIVHEVPIYPSTGGKVEEEFSPKHLLISSHTARRTFATQAMIKGWPTPLIRAITGHSTDSQLNQYIDYSMYLASVQVADLYEKEGKENRLKVI